MKPLASFSGQLSRGFVGHLAFTTVLPAPLDRLAIHFSYEKVHADAPDETTRQEVRDALNNYFPEWIPGQDDVMRTAGALKTEIQTEAFLNGQFIGGWHCPHMDRIMEISHTDATPGCMPQDVLSGSLTVQVIVFNVLFDETPYTLTIFGEEESR